MPKKNTYQELNSVDPASGERHVLVHMPDKSARWSHHENLDDFFRRVYEYHQRGGFLCMVSEDFMEVLQFAFVAAIFVVLSSCLDYAVLFRNKFPVGYNKTESLTPYKTTFSSVWVPNCGAHLSFGVVFVLIIAVTFGLIRLVRAVILSFRYFEIRHFYHEILNFQTTELTNLTWYQIQQRLCEVQVEHQLCIHKRTLTELDVYQRILRYENYLVALFNKEHFPPKLYIAPLDDELVFFTGGLRFNIELLLFWGPQAPWENYWHLDPALKREENLPFLTRRLQKVTLWLGVINLLLSPLVFLWQILSTICQYTDLIRRDPAVLGARRWSIYAQLYLRHFNELEHELRNRLCRAYKPSVMYMDLFISPLTVVIAKNTIFFAGGALAIMLALTVLDEDVLQVEHLLLVMTLLGGLVAGARGILPDENQIFCPELLLNQILAHIHYMPDSWKHYAHTARVRQQFCQLFQYRIVWILIELLSPLITPFVLIFWLRPRIGQLLEFMHQHTIEVPGLGDVCSFSQLDLGRHGSTKWNPEKKEGKAEKPQKPDLFETRETRENPIPAALGKTEISLLHFAITNPTWQPGARGNKFLKDLKNRAVEDGDELQRAQAAVYDNPLLASLTSIGCFYNAPMGGLGGLAPLGTAHSVLHQGPTASRPGSLLSTIPQDRQSTMHSTTPGDLAGSRHDSPDDSPVKYRGSGVRTSDVPLVTSFRLPPNVGMPTSAGSSLVLGSLQASGVLPPGPSIYAGGSINTDMDNFGAIREMTMSVLYLHELHRQRLRGKTYGSFGPGQHPQGQSPFSPHQTSTIINSSQSPGFYQDGEAPRTHYQGRDPPPPAPRGPGPNPQPYQGTAITTEGRFWHRHDQGQELPPVHEGGPFPAEHMHPSDDSDEETPPNFFNLNG